MDNKLFKNHLIPAFSFAGLGILPFTNETKPGKGTFFQGSTSGDQSETQIEAESPAEKAKGLADERKHPTEAR